MVASLQIGSGISIGGSINVGPFPVTPPAGTGAITYAEMNPPIIPGQQLQDPNAIINAPTGFTITGSNVTGVAVMALTSNNAAYFSTLGTGTFTATLGPGSTYASSSVNITQAGSPLVFFFDPGLSYPATFNFPFVIS